MELKELASVSAWATAVVVTGLLALALLALSVVGIVANVTTSAGAVGIYAFPVWATLPGAVGCVWGAWMMVEAGPF
jgi:hypothetical protein